MHIGIGVDVSKGKSTICIITTEGEILNEPFEIEHTREGMDSIIEKIKIYPKESIKFLMEATGHYHIALLNYLLEHGYFVTVINSLVIKKYNDMDLRKVKTDKKDAYKLAQYASEQWFKLNQAKKQEEIRSELLFLSREYIDFVKVQTKLKIQLTDLLIKLFLE